MKKLYYLIVLALILGLTLTGCTLLSNIGQTPTSEQSGITYLTKGGPTENEADEYILYAGQTIDVGTVKVWNDHANLYVKYETTDGWVMTETHLAVADLLDGIPQTKKKNPIPGQFPYQCCYDEDVTQWVFQNKEGNTDAGCDADGNPAATLTEILYTIPLLSWTSGTPLFIAAHAVVVDMNIDSKTEVVVVSRPGIDVYEPLNHYASLEPTDWGILKSAVATWVHPSWPWQTGLDDGIWISTAYIKEVIASHTWRWFHDEITLPEKGIYISSGMVVATADNAEEFYFNGEFIGSNQDWSVTTTYSIEPQPGTNILDFIVKEWGGATGLIYKATIVYYPEETAWADGGRFTEKGNWATYFEYTVQSVNLLELFEKNPDTWIIEEEGAWGQLIYNTLGPTFDFVFCAEGLDAITNYSLIYYADPWPGDGMNNLTGALIANMDTDGDGKVCISGSVDLNTDLPNSDDYNASEPCECDPCPGAKIWLVLSNHYSTLIPGDQGYMTGWDPVNYLFEGNSIEYVDTSI